MRIPVLQGVIDRRLLVNYRVRPDAIVSLLPAPFRPKLIRGWAIAGICLIRLRELRPRFLPAFVGMKSENAAHRIAVQWDDHGTVREGVYIPRRDSNSRFNTLVGGRLFPGVHHHARFITDERDDHVSIDMASVDGQTKVKVRGSVVDALPAGSIFESLDEASGFFEGGSLGYSVTRTPDQYDGLELRCKTWSMQVLAVDEVRSSLFDDRVKFPADAVAFDCALLMRGIEHEWHSQPSLCGTEPATT